MNVEVMFEEFWYIYIYIYIYIKEGYLKANLFLQIMEITYAFEFDDGELTSSTRKKKRD